METLDSNDLETIVDALIAYRGLCPATKLPNLREHVSDLIKKVYRMTDEAKSESK